MFLLSRQKAETGQRSAVDCYLVSLFLKEAKGHETAAGSIQPPEQGRRGDALPVLRSLLKLSLTFRRYDAMF
jgi:hypothetical protein